MKTLNFLDSFWQKAKEAIKDIETELPKVANEDILKPLGTTGKMWTVQYKDLSNTWSPKDLIQRNNGKSKNLEELVDKVHNVFKKSPDQVSKFLTATAERGYFINHLTNKKIVLNTNEIARLKLYVKDNS